MATTINYVYTTTTTTIERTTHLKFPTHADAFLTGTDMRLLKSNLHSLQLNQQNPKGVTTTQDYSFLKEASPIYVTSLSNNTVTSAATATAKINPQQQVKSPTVKSVSNPLFDVPPTVGNHPELHQSNSTSNQLLTTSIIRKPITSSSTTVDNNKTIQNNINYIASASNPSLTSAPTQVATPLTAIPLTDPSSDLIKHSAILHNNVNVLNNASSSQLPNNLELDPIDSCTSYYSNNRTEVLLTLILILNFSMRAFFFI